MADLMLLGLFDNVETTADVIDDVRDLGVSDAQLEVLSNIPYPAKFFGLKTPGLMFWPFVFGGAILGALVAYFITFITPDLYPIHVGGQELTPVPPTAIMFFEFISLFSMLGAFIGFLLQNRFPILVREMYDELITDGYIGVQVQIEESVAEQVIGVFEKHHAHKINRELASEFKPQGIRHLFFWGAVAGGGLVVMLVPLLVSYEKIPLPWINKMNQTVVVGYQEGPRLAAPEEAVPFQGPRLIAGQPGTEPLEATESSIARGAALFQLHCAICHGETAQGDGPLSGYYTADHGFPVGVPALAGKGYPGSYIFEVVTNGRVGQTDDGTEFIKMPSLVENVSPGDTWDIINYINSLDAE
ncbi:MAG: DUF3341 domain-containing protein [Anaerolineae bacterium]|nr:DUF3341 domain-containing protein [Anaerolineae bacterium]